MPTAGPCRRDIAANQGEDRDDEIEPPDEGPANRERELIGLLGTQLIRRHPTVSAVADQYVYENAFDLQTCLIEMVKAQAVENQELSRIAIEAKANAPAKLQIVVEPAVLQKQMAANALRLLREEIAKVEFVAPRLARYQVLAKIDEAIRCVEL